MYDIAGERTGAGNPDWLAQAKPASRHAAAVEKLLAAGATITGKTICDEFFYSVSGINAHYGTPTNVRAPGRIPGGSSSGSAAAAAAGACDIALGSDTGGSVRIPAALCGLYGIRTTLGRVDKAAPWTCRRRSTPSAGFPAWPACSAAPAPCCWKAARLRPHRKALVRGRRLRRGRRAGRGIAARRARRDGRRMPTPQTMRVAPDGLDGWRDVVRVIQAHEIWQVYGRFVEDRPRGSGPASPSACRSPRRSARPKPTPPAAS